MKKPKFGIVIAVGKSPMGEAYKKAVGKVGPPIAPPELAPKGKTPAEKDPKMLAPKKPGAAKPKDKGMLPPKSGKPSTKPRRSGKEM
jgi:hypothetical protein